MHIHKQYCCFAETFLGRLQSPRPKRRLGFPSAISAPVPATYHQKARNGLLPGTNVVTSRSLQGARVLVFARE